MRILLVEDDQRIAN